MEAWTGFAYSNPFSPTDLASKTVCVTACEPYGFDEINLAILHIIGWKLLPLGFFFNPKHKIWPIFAAGKK